MLECSHEGRMEGTQFLMLECSRVGRMGGTQFLMLECSRVGRMEGTQFLMLECSRVGRVEGTQLLMLECSRVGRMEGTQFFAHFLSNIGRRLIGFTMTTVLGKEMICWRKMSYQIDKFVECWLYHLNADCDVVFGCPALDSHLICFTYEWFSVCVP